MDPNAENGTQGDTGGAAALLTQGGGDPPPNGAGGEGSDGQGQGDQGKGSGELAPWIGELPEELQAIAKNKDWKSPLDAVASYQSLEKIMGAEKAGRPVIVLPEDEKDEAGWGKVFEQLGRPKEASEYGLDKLDGADPDFAKWAADTFHTAGVSGKQAAAIAEKWQAYQAELVKQEDDQFAQTSKSDMEALKKEWGGDFDGKVELARRLVQNIGAGREDLGADLASIERVMGTRKFMTFFADLGAKLGEDQLPGTRERGGNLGGSKSALAEIETLKTDKDFNRKMQAGDATAKKRWDDLHQQAYGG